MVYYCVMEELLTLRAVSKTYLVEEADFYALKKVDLSFGKTGFNMVLGPSGCGKTTLLNIIGGLDKASSGTLLIDGKSTAEFKDADWDDYRNKKVGFVFQSYYLIPHLNVLSNVELPLALRGLKKEERKEKALEALKAVGLEGIAKKKPNELSGGQEQRVAIARAIAGGPSIILADEPTGALDSKTSIQVMDILKELSKERAVIMVTHNRDLAEKYADRIIEMNDGEVVSDRVIHEQKAIEGTPASEEKGKKASMGVGTAAVHSLKSLRTKFGRSVLTALACSVGIIGVAMVLSVSNGFSTYVDNIESSVAGSIPITITPTYYSSSSNTADVDYTAYPDSDELYVYYSSSTSYVVHRNAYDQDYFDYLEAAVEKGLASSVMYTRESFSFNILTEDGDSGEYMLVNQEQSVSGISSLVSGLPSTIFHELYGNEETLSANYDLIYGSFPEAADEIVLVTDRYNRIQLSTLQGLGIVGSDADVDNGTAISFSSIVYDGEGDTEYKPYKAYRVSDFYSVGETDPYTVTMDNYVIDDIYGVTADGTRINTALGLLTDTLDHFEVDSHPETKEVTYYDSPYYPYRDAADIYNDDEEYNPINLKIVGVLRPNSNSLLTMMPSSIGYTQELSDLLAADVAEDGPGYPIASLVNENYVLDATGLATLEEFLSTPISELMALEDTSSIQTVMNSLYTYIYPWAYKGTEPGTSRSASTYMYYCRYVGGDPVTNVDIDFTDVTSLLTSFMDPDFYNGQGENGYGLFDLIAYINGYSLVTSISIFPASLSTRSALLAYLDAYNDGKDSADQILYSDLFGDITSMISVVTTAVPAILVVFASVSLIVSSVMMAVITYVSVLERTKEIGILRSVGARKKDITRLFEIECSLVGLIAGAVGIAISALLCIPVNALLTYFFPDLALGSIASMNGWIALSLIALAVVLALVSGFVPSKLAARRDPVRALRSE